MQGCLTLQAKALLLLVLLLLLAALHELGHGQQQPPPVRRMGAPSHGGRFGPAATAISARASSATSWKRVVFPHELTREGDVAVHKREREEQGSMRQTGRLDL